MSICLLYVTIASRDDALTLAHALVEAGQAACANIIEGVTSVYRWRGETHEDGEVVLILKTRTELADAAIAHLNDLHPYECPCILRLPVDGGNPDFLNWIAAETAVMLPSPESR